MKLRNPKEDRKRNITKLFFPLFIIAIMALSVFGVVFFGVPSAETFEYKDHTFVLGSATQNQLTTTGYSTTIEGTRFTFLYDPRELQELPSAPITLTQLQYSSKFYLSINPKHDTSLAINEFNRLLIPLLAKRVTLTCTEDLEGCEDLLIKTCEDATPEAKVIVYEESETPEMSYKLNCLKIQGSGQDMARLTDKLALDFIIP